MFIFKSEKLLLLKLGKHSEINHAILLREETFGIVVLMNLFFVRTTVLSMESSLKHLFFHCNVPIVMRQFPYCFFHVAEFDFRMFYLCIGLYSAFLFLALESTIFRAYFSFLRLKVGTTCSYSFNLINSSFFGTSNALENSFADTL